MMMTKLFAIFSKEWRLLWRDKVGLIFLFLLPMCLVLFITLTTTVGSNQPRKLQLLLINQDPNGEFSKGIVQALQKVDQFKISQSLHKSELNIDNAKKAVADGDYQAIIIIPAGLGQDINNTLQQKIRPNSGPAKPAANIAVKIFFDPAFPKNFQDQVTSAMQLITQNIELRLWQQVVSQLTSQPKPAIDANKTGMVNINTDYVQTANSSMAQPNDVQQNVPAWALFGMFFIITPLSGMIVKERRLGVVDRLWIAPVSLHTVLWGKICAFVCINLLQLALMLAVGVFIMPLFKFPALEVIHHLGPILTIGIAASLAATGFGMLIGSLVKTPEQASVIGPFIIVIMAAIGGIFVPTYLLPQGLKNITQFSPMYWALQSFIDIFVRNAGILQLWHNIAKLLIFALVTISLASVILGRYRR